MNKKQWLKARKKRHKGVNVRYALVVLAGCWLLAVMYWLVAFK